MENTYKTNLHSKVPARRASEHLGLVVVYKDAGPTGLGTHSGLAGVYKHAGPTGLKPPRGSGWRRRRERDRESSPTRYRAVVLTCIFAIRPHGISSH